MMTEHICQAENHKASNSRKDRMLWYIIIYLQCSLC